MTLILLSAAADEELDLCPAFERGARGRVGASGEPGWNTLVAARIVRELLNGMALRRRDPRTGRFARTADRATSPKAD